MGGVLRLGCLDQLAESISKLIEDNLARLKEKKGTLCQEEIHEDAELWDECLYVPKAAEAALPATVKSVYEFLMSKAHESYEHTLMGSAKAFVGSPSSDTAQRLFSDLQKATLAKALGDDLGKLLEDCVPPLKDTIAGAEHLHDGDSQARLAKHSCRACPPHRSAGNFLDSIPEETKFHFLPPR